MGAAEASPAPRRRGSIRAHPDLNRWLVGLDPNAAIAHSALVPDHRVRETLVSYRLYHGDVDRTSHRRWRGRSRHS
jgi:hypothetical protein